MGVGKEVDRNELAKIASDDKEKHVLLEIDFERLIDSLKLIHDSSCVSPAVDRK